MLKNYLTVTLRVLRKHPGYTGINVVGLAVGLACCLLILLFVQHERAFDAFHTNGDRLYRLNKVVTPQEGGTERHAISSGPMGPAMAADFPEVEATVRVLPWFDDVLMARDETTLKTPDLMLADANFFEVFDYDLVRGDPATVLEAPLSMVLTESTARYFFGDADPIGQTVRGLNHLDYAVTGITADAPAHSHLRYDAIISWSSTGPGEGTLNFGWLNNWFPQAIYTYVLLTPDAPPAALEAKLGGFMEQYFPQRAEQYHLYLQPFTDIYLGSSDLLHNERIRQGNRLYVYVFSIIAVLILAIACINFMNLVTARATRRAKEVGVRKVVGARRAQLAAQFFSEAVFTTVAALLLALGLVEIARPALSAFTGKALSLEVLSTPWLLAALVGLPMLVALVAGAYPALVLSGFRPVRVLKGQVSDPSGSLALRRVLVTTQFVISIVLIAGTLIVYRQMAFLQDQNLGFSGEQVMVLPTGSTAIAQQFEAFKAEVLQHPAITDAAGSNSVPGRSMMGFELNAEGKSDDETWTAVALRVDDFDLLNTLGMDLVDGRYFSADFPSDSTEAIVINEAMARMLGWTEPVGMALDLRGETEGARVIGVLKDYHYESLHHAIDPLAIYVAPRGENLSVRITGNDIPGTLDYLEATWARFDPAYPFEYSFLDESFAAQYTNEQRLMQTLTLFAALAILIACLGLFGLAAFTAERRTKEIGVRKVLGASVGGIVLLLSKDFARLVVIALVVAAPLAYFAMDRWLTDFAYRIDLGVGPFVLAGFAALGVALLTISYQSIRAAIADPVKSLRYE